MNAAMIAAIFAGLTFILTLFGVVFIGGKVSQTVEDHGVILTDHKAILKEHDTRLGKTEFEVFGLKRWHDGYEAHSSDKLDK